MPSTGKEFFNLMVVPTVNEFIQMPCDLRRGLLAVLVLNHVIDHIAQEGLQSEIRDVMNKRVDDVRERLLKKCPAFQLIHDVADVAKHAKLAISKKTPSVQREVMNSNNVNATAGIFQAPFGESVFGEASEIMVTLKDGSSRALLPLVKTVFDAIPPFL